jgi:hypothetical protein
MVKVAPMKPITDHVSSAKRSPSAEMVAVLRAAHQELDRPLVHSDPLAMRVIGPQGRAWLEANRAVVQQVYVRAIRSKNWNQTTLDEINKALGEAGGVPPAGASPEAEPPAPAEAAATPDPAASQ